MPQILYIDDDCAEHKFFEHFLKTSPQHGVELTCVDTLEAAIKCLQTGAIDIVFLDDRFRPYMSSLETLPKIQPHLNSAKIAIVSSSTDASHLKSASMLGVDGIFNKDALRDLLSGNVFDIFAKA